MKVCKLTDILSALGDWSAEHCHKLVSIQPDLKPVVDESKEWSQGKGCHKDGDEPVLDDCMERKTKAYEHSRRLTASLPPSLT